MPRGRPAIDPARKKRSASYTLSATQHYLCHWTAAQLGISASEMVGKLIEREAKRVARAKSLTMPQPDPDQTSIEEVVP